MRDGAVVALEEVLDDDLPVRSDDPLSPATAVFETCRVEPVGGQRGGQPAERLRERCRVEIGVHEDERPPGVDEDGSETPFGAIESRFPVGAWRGAQRPVEVVRPGVVRALQRLTPAAAVRYRMPAVPADVDERAQFARAVAEHDDRRRAGVAREELPLLGDLTDVARVLPRAAEDPLLLLPMDGRVRVPRRWERQAGAELLLE